MQTWRITGPQLMFLCIAVIILPVQSYFGGSLYARTEGETGYLKARMCDKRASTT